MADIRRLPVPVTEIWDWQMHGACRGMNSDLFFHPDRERGPSRVAREARAKQVCRGCPVLDHCRRHALAVHEPYGVWGGLSEAERDQRLRSSATEPDRSRHPARVADAGTATRALLAVDRHGTDDAALAERICRACMSGLDVDGAVLSLLTATVSRVTLWASDATAELIEELQFTLNEGACMEAAATGRPVLVPDLHHSSDAARWPVFAAAVAERTGVRALFALPLQWGTVNLGVLDLYRLTAGGLDPEQYRDALGVADLAALMMLDQRTEPALGAGSDRRWSAVASSHHAEVHQATGIVLAQLGIGPTEALARLRAQAFVEQRLLVDVAHDVVTRRLRFTEEMR